MFDFYFEALVPGEEGPVAVHVDVEGQVRFKEKYDMVNRAQFYCARLVSSQYGREFSHSNYNEIKRVVSVWLFVDAPPELQGSIMATKTDWVVLAGNPVGDPGPFDLMTAVFAFLGAEASSSRSDVVGLLGTMLERSVPWAQKRSIIEESYGIAVSPSLEAASMVMSEFDADMVELYLERFEREGHEKGFACGREEGRKEGRKEGREEGRAAALADAVRGLMVNTGVVEDAALDMLGIEDPERRCVLELLE